MQGLAMEDMDIKPTLVLASGLNSLFEIASIKDINIEPLLKKAAIDPSVLGEEHSLILQEKAFHLFGYIVDEVGELDLSFEAAKCHFRAANSAVGNLFLTTENLRDRLMALHRYNDLLFHLTISELVENEKTWDLELDSCSLDLKYLRDELPKFYGMYVKTCELAFAAVWGMFSQGLSEDVSPIKVSFRYPMPKNFRTYMDTFNCPVYFSQKSNCISFSKKLCESKVSTSMPIYHSKTVARAEVKLNYLRGKQKLLDAVYQYISDNVGDPDMSFENAAFSLNMTTRTLQRSLKLQNTSFVELRDKVRSSLALKFMSTTTVSIEEVAFSVGFADTSGFYIAFKRWHGVSPRSYFKK